ncbi:MAG: DUF177 domain-containing protein [Trueperaceae bacterium]
MLSRSDATLNLSALLTNAPGAPLEVQGSGLLEPAHELLDADGLRLAGPLQWRLMVVNTGGDDDFVLEGSVKGTTVTECRRCLTDVETEVRTSFVYPMQYRPSERPLELDEVGEEGEEDLLVFGAPEVDFASFLTQMLAIEQPITALCKATCLGLNEEGVNLNEHPELAPKAPAEEPKPKSPFEALKDMDLNA